VPGDGGGAAAEGGPGRTREPGGSTKGPRLQSHQKKATREQSVLARVEQAAREGPVREQPAARGTPCDMAILEDQFADLNVGHRRPVVINKQLLHKFYMVTHYFLTRA
jgi:hypothetical protein